MSGDILLGVDIGTTAARAFTFASDGRIVRDSKIEVKIEYPRPGWAEEDPDELYNSTIEAIRHVSKTVGKRVKAIGFSGQMHGLCCVDKDGKPLTKLIPWLDVRAANHVKILEDKIGGEELYRRTGGPPLFIYVAPKILWVKENWPNIFAKSRKFLTAQDYVIHKLFGDCYTNPSLASGSQLLNINDVTWDSRVLEVLEIDESMLPTLVEGDTVFQKLPSDTAKDLGLPEEVPVALGASDGALSNVGLGAVGEGIAAINLGSSGAVRVVSKHPILDDQMRFFCYYIASRNWLPGGAVNNCGIVLRWFRDRFADKEREIAKERGVDPYKLLDEEAVKVQAGCEGLMFLPFMAGERFPIRDPFVRGMIFGLSLSHGKPHVIRCIMEGITFTLRWIQEAIEEHVKINVIKISGGGARSDLWRQIVSDICGKEVIKTEVEEASALGAAMLAGIAIGDFADMGQAAGELAKDSVSHEPSGSNHELYSRIFETYKRAYKNCRSISQELLEIEGEKQT